MTLDDLGGEKLPPDTVRVLKEANRRVALLEILVDDLALYLRLEARIFRYSPITIAVRELTASTMDELAPAASARDVALQSDCESVDLRGHVKVDPRCFSRVMKELLTHALDASSPGGTICVRLACIGPKFRWTVGTEAAAIDEGLRRKIFDPFELGGAKASGLGLTIARGMARLADGDLTSSNTAEGTTAFHLDLPIAQNALA